MQTLDNNEPQNQKQDESTQPLIESLVSKEGEEEEAGRAKAENDGPSQAIAPADSSPVSDPSTTAPASASDETKSLTSSAAATESLLASNNAPTTNASSSTHHPPTFKRFSSANISKQFLHKATSGIGSRLDGVSQHPKPTPSNSALSATSRPAQPTPTAQPSRLVTAKLTTNGPSSASSTGWSTPRPGSASNTANPSPAQTPGVSAPSSKQSPPSIAGAGVSSERSNSGTRSGPSGKPWGDVKRVTPSVPVTNAASDFPTAAEVARGKSQATKPQKQIPPQLATDASSKSLLNESADAFRGVHLDPKAHHWDEDEGDDDNYLGEVVEFADGTQYSVPPTATAENHPPTSLLDAAPPSEAAENEAPIRKEDRFPDDFDRSWPKGRGSSNAVDSPSTYPRELPSPAQSHSTLHSEQGERGNRVLFNERSNRMEPAHSTWGRRESDGPNGRRPPFSNRERPPFGGRDRWAPGGEYPSQGRPPRGERSNYGGNRRTDMPPPPPPGSHSMEGSSWGRNSYRRPSNASQDDSPRMMPASGPRNRVPPSDAERDFHRPRLPSGAPSRLEPSSPRMHRTPDQRFSDRPPPFGSNGRRESVASSIHKSPLLQSQSITGEPVSPSVENGPEVAPITGDQLDPATKAEKLAALTKSEMHNAAQRARERRLKEEEERQKQQERARAKADALAAQQEEATKAAEAERRRQEEEQRKQEEQKAKAEADKLEKERAAAEEQERVSRSVADPLSAKSGSATRPKLQLLPRSVPLPPPEIPTARRKETRTAGDVTPLPGSAVTDVVQALAEKHDDDIQVVDYEHMGLVMGGVSSQQQHSESTGGKPRRAIASDYFRDTSPHGPNAAADSAEAFISEALKEETPDGKPTHSKTAGRPSRSPTGGHSPPDNLALNTFGPTSPARRPPPVVPPSPGFSNARQPPLLSPSRFREAPLSSVSETISRLKGVLKSMADEHRQDDFAVTISPSESAVSPSATIVVKISKSRIGQPSAPVKGLMPRHPKDKSLQIQSFDPPISNLNPATLSRDEVVLKGSKNRLASVKLPTTHSPEARNPSSGSSAVQKGPPSSTSKGGFGRGNKADEANWRKPKESKIGQSGPLPVKEVEVLSRSPHPISTDISEPATVHVPPSSLEKEEAVSSPTTSPKGSKGRPPSGVDVLLYRSPSMEKQHPVRFTVTSEIETSGEATTGDLATRVNAESTKEEKKLDETPSSQSGSTLLTPPLANTTTAWVTSPLGFPVPPLNTQADSDGVKAVWDSAASAAGTLTENSLRGIVDELPPTIPMSVQELKSDDNDNKANQGIAVTVASSVVPDPPATKRSLQDAHRAFQIVPESPASATKPPSYPLPPPVNAAQRSADPNPTMLPPSPYMMPGQPPFAAPNGYGPRPPYGHPTPPTPNMMWGQPPAQFVPNGSLSVRQQTPGGTGPSPPLPQQWIGQPQSQQAPTAQLPPPFQGTSQFSYMQGPGMQPQQKLPQNMGPPMNHMGVGGSHLGPHNPSPMSYPNPTMGQHLQPQGQGFPHRPPPHMTSPNLYNVSPVISSPGYNPAMAGPNRNMSRPGFELPPPATPQLYPQLQTRPFHPPGWSFAS